MNQTIWKEVLGYEKKYLINELGTIISQNSGHYNKILLPRIDRAGYYTVRLSQNGVTNTKYLHRLLAENYIPNPEKKSFVNHLNGNKLDNCLINLQWSTHSENIKHAYNIGLCNKVKEQTPVIDICSNIKFESIKKASEYHSIPYSTCKGYLNGNRKNSTCLRILKTSTAA